ncbi:MAG TPA: ribosome biogenesis factor YjgA [Gammaproteobacteria bacterium]|nr:ribosome biogenesis factor YjgA [Gammaproteobacteria bacterium]
MARKRMEEPEPDELLESAADDEEEETEGRGRGKRKRESHEIRDLGVELTHLAADKLAALPLPEVLRDAIVEARRLTSFGAQRRQAQFIGKLLRRLDADALGAVRAAVHLDRSQAARATALLHRVERWRDALIDDDSALERWLAEFPATDAQQLRALIRQARKDARTGQQPGEAPRQGRAYRQIFALVRGALVAGTDAAVDQ